MKLTVTKHLARVNNPDGWRHGETGAVLGIVGDTIVVEFPDLGTTGFSAEMVTVTESKTQKSLFDKSEETVGRGSVPKAVFVMS
jgi:hypothetical protein